MYVTGQNKIQGLNNFNLDGSQLPLSSSPYLRIVVARGQRKLRVNLGKKKINQNLILTCHIIYVYI